MHNSSALPRGGNKTGGGITDIHPMSCGCVNHVEPRPQLVQKNVSTISDSEECVFFVSQSSAEGRSFGREISEQPLKRLSVVAVDPV